jgi:hypothetical protein
MTVWQLPGFAFRTQADHVEQMDVMRERYAPTLGRPGVDVMERLGLFSVFVTWWFDALLALMVLSIVVCTLDRVPRAETAGGPAPPGDPETAGGPAPPGDPETAGGPAPPGDPETAGVPGTGAATVAGAGAT